MPGRMKVTGRTKSFFITWFKLVETGSKMKWSLPQVRASGCMCWTWIPGQPQTLFYFLAIRGEKSETMTLRPTSCEETVESTHTAGWTSEGLPTYPPCLKGRGLILSVSCPRPGNRKGAPTLRGQHIHQRSTCLPLAVQLSSTLHHVGLKRQQSGWGRFQHLSVCKAPIWKQNHMTGMGMEYGPYLGTRVTSDMKQNETQLETQGTKQKMLQWWRGTGIRTPAPNLNCPSIHPSSNHFTSWAVRVDSFYAFATRPTFPRP